MNFPSPASKVAISVAALVPCIVYLTTSYAFYNLNLYKLLVAWAGSVLLLSLLWSSDASAAKHQLPRVKTSFRWHPAWVFLLPVLSALPGLWATSGRHAYFFGQEVALWFICCGWLLLLSRVLRNGQRLAEFLLAMAALVIAIATLALWHSLAGTVDTQHLLTERESGTFGNANYLACFLVMHIPLFGLCALSSWESVAAWRGRAYPRLMFLAAALMALLALFFTQSRMAMATLGLVLAALAVLVAAMPGTFPVSIRKSGGVLSGIMVAAGAVMAIVHPELVDALTSSWRSTAESRFVPWRAAWASIIEAPWLGWGSGSSYSLFFQHVDPASRLLWHERSYTHPHNEMLEILQEGGIVGLCGYLAFLGLVLGTSARLLTSPALHRDHRIIVSGILCAIATYHVVGLASPDTRMTVVRFGFFTLLAMLFCLRRVASASAPQRYSERAGAVMDVAENRINRSGDYGAVAALLFASAVLLAPDLASRHRFVLSMHEADPSTQQQLLEDIRDDNPNVYALEQLVRVEIANGDFNGAETTLQVLNELIPDYGISGYLRALSYLRQHEVAEARAAALQYQTRDRYLPQTAHLLGKIAVMRDEPGLFLQQLGLLLTPALITEVGLPEVDAESVVVDVTSGPTVCTVMRSAAEVRLDFRLNSESLARVMREAKSVFDSAEVESASAVYQKGIANSVSNILCQGLNTAQTVAFRNSLQHALSGMANRDL